MNLYDIAIARKLSGGGGGGGGSSDYPTITATWNESLQVYSYTCDWTYAEIITKLAGGPNLAGAFIMTDAEGASYGGDWSMGGEDLIFELVSGDIYLYSPDGTITIS